jgi:hypothetical protein
MSGLGAIVGTAIALALDRERLSTYVAWGTVAGGALGVCRVLTEELMFW